MIEVPSHLSDLQKEAVKSVGFYYDLAAEKLQIHLPYPKISFDLTGKVAGCAYTARNFIKLNNRFLYANTEDFLKTVCGHEAAHVFAYHKSNGRATPHGKDWASVMWTLKLPAIRCHNYLGGKRLGDEILLQCDQGTISYQGGIRSMEREL